MVTHELLEQVLKLPTAERAEVARQVLLSLEPEGFEDDAEKAWVTEIQRRREAVRRGDVQLLDWADVRQQILGELNETLCLAQPRKALIV